VFFFSISILYDTYCYYSCLLQARILYYTGRSGLIKLQWRTTSAAALAGSGPRAVFTIRDTKALTTITRCSPRALRVGPGRKTRKRRRLARTVYMPASLPRIVVAAADTRDRTRRTCNDTTLLGRKTVTRPH